jgi:hypothetical protein
MKRPLLRCGMLALLALAPLALRAEPVLIVHKGLEGQPLDAATVKSVLLGKKVAWDNGTRVTIAALKSGAVADGALKAAVDQTASQFLNHWRRLAMTGGGMAPKSFDSEAEVLKFVAETPGAIGFLDSATADASVVVVKAGG